MTTNMRRAVRFLMLGLLVHHVTAPPPLLVELGAQEEEYRKTATKPDKYPNQFSVDNDPSLTRYLNLDQFEVKDEFSDDKLEEGLYLDPYVGGQKDSKHGDFDKTPKKPDRYLDHDLPSQTISDSLLHDTSAIDLDEGVYVADEFEPLPVPTNFSQYDMNGDGYIDLEELMMATQARENAALALHASDIDGDGRLSRLEFNVAPWVIGVDQLGKNNINAAKSDASDGIYGKTHDEHTHRKEMDDDKLQNMYKDAT
ncbi:uncharacterized protein LOC132555293 [Ylistrum balloti]|uniref:uncharacterized protein LOC132555293 n=1 Tax=Ylistrum balloti TaxID=509963 RepID=UPI002905BD57|nr:uncharacterized protein LOC132555293 [Ylistrum balloti]